MDKEIKQLKEEVNYWSKRCELSEAFHKRISVTKETIKNYNNFMDNNPKAPYIYYDLKETTSGVEEVNSTMDTVSNQQEPRVLSLPEALQAMKEGKKVKHRFFSEDEWVKSNEDNTIFTFDDGVTVSASMFWLDRNGEAYLTDWIIVE